MESEAGNQILGEAEAVVVRTVVDRAIWSFFGALALVFMSFVLRETVLLGPLQIARFCAYLFFVYCVYCLSMHVEKQRSLAWTIVLLLILLAPIGWAVAWSLIRKAKKMAGPEPIEKAVAQ